MFSSFYMMIVLHQNNLQFVLLTSTVKYSSGFTAGSDGLLMYSSYIMKLLLLRMLQAIEEISKLNWLTFHTKLEENRRKKYDAMYC